MEPSAVRFQCQTLAVNPNEQINSVSSKVSLLELSFSASLARRWVSTVRSLPLLGPRVLVISLEKEWKCEGSDDQTGKGYRTRVRAHEHTHTCKLPHRIMSNTYISHSISVTMNRSWVRKRCKYHSMYLTLESKYINNWVIMPITATKII